MNAAAEGGAREESPARAAAASLMQMNVELSSRAPTARAQFAHVQPRLEPLPVTAAVASASALLPAWNTGIIVASNWKRQDPIPPPTVQAALDWFPIVEHLVTDSAAGSNNSVVSAWQPEKPPEWIHCMAHTRIFINKNKPKIQEKKYNPDKIKHDFHDLQSACLTVALNDLVFDRMMLWWREEYDEGIFVDEFEKSWRPPVFISRVKANRWSSEKAGVPNHNNGAEGLNASDKEYFAFERPAIVRHVSRMQERIHDRSYFDVDSGAHINCKTWNGVFFKDVFDYLALTVCPLDPKLLWKWSKFKEEHGDGVHEVKAVIFPSKATVLQITNDSSLQATDSQHVRQILKNKTGGGEHLSYIDTYKSLFTHPLDAINGKGTGGIPWDFKLCMQWMKGFRMFVEVEGDEAERLLCRWEKGACSQGKASPSVLDRAAAKAKGVYRCKCAEYLMREVCLHIAAYNIKHGIMTYPVNFNPTRTGSGKRGRPAKAVGGQALRK